MPYRQRKHGGSSLNGLHATRTAVLGISRMLLMTISASAAPIIALEHNDGDDPDASATPLWILYVASIVLVLLGGAFAGLTIAYVSLHDSSYRIVLSDQSSV